MSTSNFDPYPHSQESSCTGKERPKPDIQLDCRIHITVLRAIVFSTGDHIVMSVGTATDVLHEAPGIEKSVKVTVDQESLKENMNERTSERNLPVRCR